MCSDTFYYCRSWHAAAIPACSEKPATFATRALDASRLPAGGRLCRQQALRPCCDPTAAKNPDGSVAVVILNQDSEAK